VCYDAVVQSWITIQRFRRWDRLLICVFYILNERRAIFCGRQTLWMRKGDEVLVDMIIWEFLRICAYRGSQWTQTTSQRRAQGNDFLLICESEGVRALSIKRLTNLCPERLQIRSIHDGRCHRRLFELRDVNQTGPPHVDSSFTLDWVDLSR